MSLSYLFFCYLNGIKYVFKAGGFQVSASIVSDLGKSRRSESGLLDIPFFSILILQTYPGVPVVAQW